MLPSQKGMAQSRPPATCGAGGEVGCVMLHRDTDAGAARQEAEELAKGRESWVRLSVSRCFAEVEGRMKQPTQTPGGTPETPPTAPQPAQ